MKEAHKNREPQSQETKQKRSKSLSGVPKSDEHKQALSRALKGRVPWNKGLGKTSK